MRIDIAEKRFGAKVIFSDRSFEFPDGGRTAILGESGKGKTTLMRMLSGLDRDFNGVICGQPQRPMVLFQEDRLSEGISVMANLLAVTDDRNAASRVLRDVGLGCEERVITRVGSCRPIPINVRIVAATNRPLQDMIKIGQFRADLYYRLNVLSLCTLPLREMRDEIKSFLTGYLCQLCNRPIAFTKEAIGILEEYSWPGNFRELKNLVEYLYYTCQSKEQINVEDLPEYLLQEMGKPTAIQKQNMEELEQLCTDVSPLRDILKILYEANPRGIGRGTILSALRSSDIDVSEGKLKHYMEQLKKYGLVYSGSTKQGSFLTSKGLEFFNAYCLH